MFSSWLWPDHVAGKRRTRAMREEYNRLLNVAEELATAGERALQRLEPFTLARFPDMVDEVTALRAALAKWSAGPKE